MVWELQEVPGTRSAAELRCASPRSERWHGHHWEHLHGEKMQLLKGSPIKWRNALVQQPLEVEADDLNHRQSGF